MGYEDDAEVMEQEYQDYGDRWSMESLYEILASTISGGTKATTKLLYDLKVAGVIARNAWLKGIIYVAFSDDIIKITDVYQV
jgi:hypothetical protein